MSEVSNQHSTLAREVLDWLADNEQEQFNITCQRCQAPFTHEGQPVAAPAEWFGGLDWERQLAEAVISLEEQLEALRGAVRKGLIYAEACESWPSTPSEKEHYRQEVESMRTALNPAMRQEGDHD